VFTSSAPELAGRLTRIDPTGGAAALIGLLDMLTPGRGRARPATLMRQVART
jgi:hypothetical protein